MDKLKKEHIGVLFIGLAITLLVFKSIQLTMTLLWVAAGITLGVDLYYKIKNRKKK